jgi:hypothetical protein
MPQQDKILTWSCRIEKHEHCEGHIYLGNIMTDPPSDCECDCHEWEGYPEDDGYEETPEYNFWDDRTWGPEDY